MAPTATCMPHIQCAMGLLQRDTSSCTMDGRCSAAPHNPFKIDRTFYSTMATFESCLAAGQARGTLFYHAARHFGRSTAFRHIFACVFPHVRTFLSSYTYMHTYIHTHTHTHTHTHMYTYTHTHTHKHTHTHTRTHTHTHCSEAQVSQRASCSHQ